MDMDVSRLDETLADRGLDGHLLDADSTTADQRYLSGFDAPDPFLTLYMPDRIAVLVSSMEYERARSESRADVVRRRSAYDYNDLVDTYGSVEGRARAIAAFLEEFDVEAASVNPRFPLITADELRERGIEIDADQSDAVEKTRAVKTETEIAYIREAQRANEAAMAEAERLIAEATVVDGVLHHQGDPLTSERVRRAIERTLLDHDCALDETIVAAGPDAANPHDVGSGPIREDEAIIVDIFPKDKRTQYHADMTRTFLHGTPGEEIDAFHAVTRDAKRAALDAVEPGVSGQQVHDAACTVYEAAGYPTLRTDEGTSRGYIHSTGHGVGLEVHERPRVSRNGETLEPGHVITIEPGLYDPAIGGVRIEDLVVVTEDGYENLTDYHEDLIV
ncbi:M24 family metallopeptidase [Halanaeroarchaeum sulfurireducens]|uniref:Xaa-Pro aminopeptidase n=1 Tax=Halanaeroarchaeum sulfurireducens TaxID=1604004 RepID=A0A0F7PAC6_9EURY|nr:Xaa-Pro peptidase family protein [Halanaeroarchaeum sulfurireducens]AKH98116.1 Xaa-Pro aminopeptidase [Halanaeroarchaeum sulfurireducens]ALG82510.1 Xaa-Pro aminopeptidase [Halanaeroarchaeum sulfurireducens]